MKVSTILQIVGSKVVITEDTTDFNTMFESLDARVKADNKGNKQLREKIIKKRGFITVSPEDFNTVSDLLDCEKTRPSSG